MHNIRIGQAVDIHQLQEGRKLILGGVEIEHSKGLLGHSDADVLVHAVGESILGALALGDLGKHFPDTDPKYKGANSLDLLAHIYEMMNEMGYQIGNVDALMQLLRLIKLGSLSSKPLENLQSVFLQQLSFCQ